MAAKLEKLDANKAKLEIGVSAQDFENGINKAYQKLKGKFNIPGFRKGKAPRAIIENHYGPQVFYEDAFDEVFPEAYRAAVEEHSLEVVSRPENVEILSLDPKEGILFTVEMYLKPEVKLGQYDGIKVQKTLKNVTAKDVDAEIEKIRNQNVRWVEVDRAAKDGDTVLIDYSGSVDGVKFEGGTAEGQSLLIGSGRFIPGFEEQLIGMKKDDQKDINVTFPKEYAPELAEKDAVFAITMHEVKEKELPALDDDFAQDVSEFDTLADYKKDVKKRLKKQAEERAKMEMENQLLGTVAREATIDIPEVMVDSQVDYQIQQMAYQLMYQGMKLDDYLQYAGKTMDDLKKDYRESAAEQVRMRLAVEALIKELEIDPTPEEAEKRLEELAKEAGKTTQEYKDMMGTEELDYFKERVAMERLFDYLAEKAVIEEASEEKETAKKAADKAKPAAEKKPAAKKATEKKPAADGDTEK